MEAQIKKLLAKEEFQNKKDILFIKMNIMDLDSSLLVLRENNLKQLEVNPINDTVKEVLKLKGKNIQQYIINIKDWNIDNIPAIRALIIDNYVLYNVSQDIKRKDSIYFDIQTQQNIRTQLINLNCPYLHIINNLIKSQNKIHLLHLKMKDSKIDWTDLSIKLTTRSNQSLIEAIKNYIPEDKYNHFKTLQFDNNKDTFWEIQFQENKIKNIYLYFKP